MTAATATPRKRAASKSKTTAARKPAAVKPPAGESRDGNLLHGRSDQVGAIFAKGLDLAEASLSLGLTMITRVGMAAQRQLERIATELPQEPIVAPDSPPPRVPAPEPPPPAVADERPSGIGNRQPVMPGSVVRISFSINNDSVASAKSVSVHAEDFVGELEGARIEAERFAVKPRRRRIAPLDFEKFVLEGEIPADVPSDVYHGTVVVSSGQAFSIPVRLVVQGT